MNRPLGALPDPPGETRGVDICGLVGLRRNALPESVDLRPFVHRIANQQSQDCVGQAAAQALRIRAAIEGRTIDPSGKAIYALAREMANPRAKSLADDGSYPSKAIDGLALFGAVARERWPDDADPHLRVGEDVLDAGAIATVTGTYHIATSGDGRKADIMAALADGHPVIFGMSVDQSYEDYTGGVWQGMTGVPNGGHAQCLVGYDAGGVIIANSWGERWGENGFSRIAWAAICAPAVHDFYVLTFALAEVA